MTEENKDVKLMALDDVIKAKEKEGKVADLDISEIEEIVVLISIVAIMNKNLKLIIVVELLSKI